MTNTSDDNFSNFNSCEAKAVDSNEVEIIELIGVGSYGKVYKSLFEGRLVAVKQNQDEKEYLREKSSLMQVSHPNIVTLIGFCHSHLSLIMELCEETLSNVLHVRKTLKFCWGHAIQWSKDCAEAVRYLHSFSPKPLLHRDLKPTNMLLVDQGRVIKLTDFGTMRQQSVEMTNGIGTPIYMAPEVCSGNEYTTKCDVFSWGIMLWEILCRKVPFDTLERCAILFQKVMRKTRPPPLEGCPDRIEKFIERCWHEKPDERPTMDEVAAEMTQLRQLFFGELRPVYVESDEAQSGPLEGLMRVLSSSESSK